MECLPSKVTLNNYGSRIGEVSQTIVVRGLNEPERDRLTVKPLQEWIQVTERRTIGNVVRLQVLFDRSVMPDQLDSDILQLSLDDTHNLIVSAAGRR